VKFGWSFVNRSSLVEINVLIDKSSSQISQSSQMCRYAPSGLPWFVTVNEAVRTFPCKWEGGHSPPAILAKPKQTDGATVMRWHSEAE
jgi:hypothetical protein